MNRVLGLLGSLSTFGSPLPSSGMMLRMDATQTLAGHMSVNLGGRYVRMPKHGLHSPQVRTMFEQMGGERMA